MADRTWAVGGVGLQIEREVRWGYRYYLGRPAEDSRVVRSHVRSVHSDPGMIRDILFESEEARSKGGLPHTRNEFCVWRPGAPRIAVIGNCNGPDLGRALAVTTSMSVIGFDVANEPRPSNDDVLAVLDDADFIVSIILGPDFGPLSLHALRDRYGSKVAAHPPMHFDGVQPDMTSLGSRGKRLVSPAVDYHSRFVLRSYFAQTSPEACRAAYLTEILDDLPGRFRRAADELIAREAQAELHIGEWLLAEVRHQSLFYTMNHPTQAVLMELAAVACRHFGIAHVPCTAPLIWSELASHIIWPIHEGVARELRLRYHSADVFFVGGCMLTLDEFIWRAYAVYRRQDQDSLAEAAAARGILSAPNAVAPERTTGEPIGFEPAQQVA